MVKRIPMPENCKYRKECSFYGAVKCKDTWHGNPTECILYKLIEDVQKLMAFKQEIENKNPSKNLTEQHPFELSNSE